MPALRPLTVASCARQSRAAFCMQSAGLLVAAGSNRERHLFHVALHDWALYRDHVAPHCPAISERDAVTLTYLLYQYALRTANTKNMRKYTSGALSAAAITEARESFFGHYHLVQYKMATLRCVVQRLHPTHDAAAVADQFVAVGLDAADAVLFAMLYYNGDLERFVELVNAIPDATFTLEPHTLLREIDTGTVAYTELGKTAGYFTHRKLKFITEGNRLDHADTHNGLRMRGIAAYRWVRPFYSVEHAINYAKRTIYKHAMNEIAYYTDPCRARVVQDGTTGIFTNTIAEYNEFTPADTGGVNHVEDAMIALLDAGGLHA